MTNVDFLMFNVRSKYIYFCTTDPQSECVSYISNYSKCVIYIRNDVYCEL